MQAEGLLILEPCSKVAAQPARLIYARCWTCTCLAGIWHIWPKRAVLQAADCCWLVEPGICWACTGIIWACTGINSTVWTDDKCNTLNKKIIK